MSCQQNLVPLIAAEADRQGVPEAIALGVARRETGACHWWADGSVKIGSSGEVGVMQVMPSTAPFTNLYDPENNIRAGVGYLAAMFKRFGSWPLAVAAYNWGPSGVQDVLAGRRYFPAAVNGYVNSVLGSGALNSTVVSSNASKLRKGVASSTVARWVLGITGGIAAAVVLLDL